MQMQFYQSLPLLLGCLGILRAYSEKETLTAKEKPAPCCSRSYLFHNQPIEMVWFTLWCCRCLAGKVTGEFKEVSQAENQANCIWGKKQSYQQWELVSHCSDLSCWELRPSLQMSSSLEIRSQLQKTVRSVLLLKCKVSDWYIHRVHKSKVMLKFAEAI